MDVRGYPTGPIEAKGAFTSEIDLPPIIKPGPLNTVTEADRPHLIDQPGMRHKYLPLRHDPATGAISSGGRYLFRGYEDATKYRDFLEAKVFPSEQTTFWKRPFFFNTVRFAWCVTGAHDLAPITTHDLNRFERYSVPDAKFEARLPELFPAFLEAARWLDLAHVSLMFQPEHNLVGVLTAAAREGRTGDNIHGRANPIASRRRYAQTGVVDQAFRPRHGCAPHDRGHRRCRLGHRGVAQARRRPTQPCPFQTGRDFVHHRGPL